MAGPWFVDPEGGSLTNNGLSTTTPWLLIPGQTGASAQTGYGVVAGDTINVKNGTSSSAGRLIFPANNLTYRGYGVASNVLTLTLPARDPANTIQKAVAREWGAHEGMWTLDEPAETNSVVVFSTRSGCTVEDVNVAAPLSEAPISAGTSTSTAIGCTIRRSRVAGGDGSGITAYSRQITVEDCEIGYINDDALTLGASVSNGYRAGYADVIRRVSIIEPGMDTVSAIGDAIQTFAASDRFESSLLIEDLYVYKTSAVKQSMVFTDVLGGLTLRRFHIASVPDGQAQILFSGIGGAFVVRDGYIRDGCAGNAAFRYAGSMGIETGATLAISNVLVDADENSGFFTVGGSTNAATIDGAITIAQCTMAGVNAQALSFSGSISIHPGSLITIGANCSLAAKNNCITTTGQPAFRLPTGGGNDARWQITKNATGAATFAIGSTAYATAALFEAAHSGATGTVAGDPLLSDGFRPMPASPLLGAGVHVTYRRDIEGKQRPNPPSIGAYDVATLRRKPMIDPSL